MSTQPAAGAPRVLFVRLRSLGDTVLMTPLTAVAKRLPGCRVGVVIEKPFDQVLEANPHVDQLLVVEDHIPKWRARWRILRRIRAFRPHLAVDLHGGTTSTLLTALSGAPRRVGYRRSRHSYLYNVRVPDSSQIWGRPQVHTVEHQLALLKHLGYPVEPVPPLEFPVQGSQVEGLRSALRAEGVGEGFVLVQPSAAFDTKTWPAGNFAVLIARLLQEGEQVVVTAGPGEEERLHRLRSLCPSRACFMEPMSIGRFAALASLCSLFVGNDTGTTHVAAALGKKIVVIFGSSDYKVWYPWGVPHQLIHAGLDCIPCPGYTCPLYDEPRCILSIEVDRVWESVKKLL